MKKRIIERKARTLAVKLIRYALKEKQEVFFNKLEKEIKRTFWWSPSKNELAYYKNFLSYYY